MKNLRYTGRASEVRVPKDGSDHHLKANENTNFTIEVTNEQAERILENNGDVWEDVTNMDEEEQREEFGFGDRSGPETTHSPVAENAVDLEDGDT